MKDSQESLEVIWIWWIAPKIYIRLKGILGLELFLKITLNLNIIPSFLPFHRIWTDIDQWFIRIIITNIIDPIAEHV